MPYPCRLRSMLALSLAITSLSCTPPTGIEPAHETPWIPNDGDTYTSTYAIDGKPVYEVTYRFHRLEDPAFQVQSNPDQPLSDLMALPETENLHGADPDSLGLNRTQPLPVATVRDFLAEHWDEFIDGKDDPGVNAAEFIQTITQLHLNVDEFFTLWQEAGLSLAAFVDVLTASQQLTTTDHPSAPATFFDLLDDHGVTIKELAGALQAAGLTPTEFFRRLKQSGTDIATFVAGWNESGQSFAEYIAKYTPFTVQNEYYLFGDLFIDNGYNSFTPSAGKWSGLSAVLHKSDPSPYYYLGKDFVGNVNSWTSKNFLGMTLFSCNWRLKGTYDAKAISESTSIDKEGSYVKSLRVEFDDVYTRFDISLEGASSTYGSRLDHGEVSVSHNLHLHVQQGIRVMPTIFGESRKFNTEISSKRGIVRQ